MNINTNYLTAIFFLSLVLVSINVHSNVHVTKNLTQNAKLLFESLLDSNDDLKIEEINFKDSDLNENSYLPIDLNIRKNSIALESLSIQQSTLVHKILSELLSSKGYSKLLINLLIDKQYQLTGIKKNTNHILKVYGNPNQDWGFKIEGYHISISFLIQDDKLKFVNFFIGQDTDLIKEMEYSTFQVYNYANIGSELMNSLTPKQMQKAYLGISIPTDIMEIPDHYRPHLKQRSLNSERLKKKQIIILSKWMDEYLDLINPKLVEKLTEKLEESKYEDLNISWSGSFDEDQNKYYFLFNEFLFIDFNLRLKHLHSMFRLKFN